jgi:hypothetical protein
MDKKLASIGNLNPIILATISIALLRFFFAIFFGHNASNWYVIASYTCELSAFLVAACLSFRNYFHSQILSDQKIWLCLGSGTLSFFIGDVIFLYWEVILQRSPDVSLGDIFFVIFYL